MSVIVEFSLFPMDKGQSVGAYVARAAAIVRQSGLPAVLGDVLGDEAVFLGLDVPRAGGELGHQLVVHALGA